MLLLPVLYTAHWTMPSSRNCHRISCSLHQCFFCTTRSEFCHIQIVLIPISHDSRNIRGRNAVIDGALCCMHLEPKELCNKGTKLSLSDSNLPHIICYHLRSCHTSMTKHTYYWLLHRIIALCTCGLYSQFSNF